MTDELKLVIDPLTLEARFSGKLPAERVSGVITQDDLALLFQQIATLTERLTEVEMTLQNATNNAGRLEWTIVTETSQAIAANSGYFTNNASQVLLTLPASAPVGSIVEVAGIGSGGWRISLNTGQAIQFGNKVTTTGTGSLNSTHKNDDVRLVCSSDNLWLVLSAIGNIDVL